MGSIIERDDIDEIAAAWVVRLDRCALDDDEQRELDAWLDADTRHRGAFVRAQAIWIDQDRIAALAAGRAPVEVQDEEDSGRWRRAASFVAVAIGLGLLGYTISDRYLAGREITQIGEVRRLTLDDGSAMALNTASVVQVKFGSDERRVVMHRGEASFQVVHDQERPFVVQADDVRVRAVGTAFTVRLHSDDVEVVVTEGVVEVMRDGRATRHAAERVARNQEVVVTRAEVSVEEPLRVAALSENEVARKLSWQDGKLVFQGEELARAVAEVNRYSSTPVIIEDPEIATKSFVGVFRIGDSRAFAHAAAAAFNTQIREENGALHIERSPAGQ
jgi:transmembrane sensor